MAKHYVVEKRSDAKKPVFRDSKSGMFIAKVMARDTFDKASGKANTAIDRALSRDKAPKR